MRRLISKTWLFPTLALTLALLAGPAWAQDHGTRSEGEVSKLTQEVSHEIYSPYCPGKTLAMCPSGGASKVRQDIQELAREGMSKPEIKDTIVAQYGEEFRMSQPETQDNMTLFILLAGALMVALLALFFLINRKGGSGASRASSPSDPPLDEQLSGEDEEYLAEVRKEYSG
jgi:cytochrome c-type biogenesis protein CcmH/NrfF